MTGILAAVDLGATSGRVVVAKVGPDCLDTRVVARFANTPIQTETGLYWNARQLFESALGGLHRACLEGDLLSIGVDSWAVDYAVVRNNEIGENPFHYRDGRSARGVELVEERIGRAALYGRTGLQFLPFNSLYQLAADNESGLLSRADGFLMIPDLINFWLSGERWAEATNASTTGLFDVATGSWDTELIEQLGLSPSLFPQIIRPGSEVGVTSASITEQLGAGAPVSVVAVGSHDTASAIVAVPMDRTEAAYISCGTWGLVGLELDQPILSEASARANFTNEGGVDGRIRYLHNVMGLWLLTESIRQWESEGDTIDLAGLLAEAAAVTSDVAVFDTNNPRFLPPGGMADRIAEHCQQQGLPVPHSRAQMARSIIESLAAAFAAAVRTASGLADHPVRTVHIVGGGALNTLLCQRTADHLELPVVAGPVEATALGNVLVQARSAGLLDGTLEDLRSLVRRSSELVRYEPQSEAS